MRDEHDGLLGPLPQPLAHPLGAVLQRVGVGGPETLLGGPFGDEELEVEAVEFGHVLQDLSWAAGVAGVGVAFLSLGKADDVLDTESFDGGAPCELGGLEGPLQGRGDDEFGFMLELLDLGSHGRCLLLAQGRQRRVEDCMKC